MVQLLHPDAVGHGERLVPGEDRRAGVALLLGGVPVLPVARQVQLDLMRLCLRLLQAEEIGVQRPEGVLKALLQAGADAVDVPRDQFHGLLLLFFLMVTNYYKNYNRFLQKRAPRREKNPAGRCRFRHLATGRASARPRAASAGPCMSPGGAPGPAAERRDDTWQDSARRSARTTGHAPA